jgi:FecR protein
MGKLTKSLGSLLTAWCSVALADSGKFQFVHGDVTVTRDNGSSMIPSKGDRLEEGDVIATGTQAQAQLVMNDGGLISMRPDSRLRIDQFRFNGKADGSEQGVFGLLKGGFRAITGLIGKVNKDNYKIRTATATIGIRGTDHETLYIAPPAPGETPIGPPGTYNKVNVGQTFLQTAAGRLELSSNQVGFAPAVGNTPPQRIPTIPDFLKATPDIQATAKAVGPKAAGVANEKDTPEATTTAAAVTTASLDGSTSVTSAAATPSSPVIAPVPSGVFNPANAVSAPVGTALAGGGMSASGPNNGAGTIGGPGNALAMMVDSAGDPLIITSSKFSYNRNGAPMVMSGNTTLGDQAVSWGIYDGGTMFDNGVNSANPRFFWMKGTNATTTANLLTALVSGNLSYSTVGGFTKPINETGKVGGTVTATNITIGNASGVPTLINYTMALTDAVGRSWYGNLTASQSLASFQTGGTNNLSVSCSGTCQSTGTGSAQGVVIGGNAPVGMISSYKMNSGTASVVGAVLSR